MLSQAADENRQLVVPPIGISHGLPEGRATNDRPLRWDIFCAVVDHYGDIGVCWRLARQIAHERGAQVRLWVDDLNSFARLCSELDPQAETQHIGAIQVCHWSTDFPDVDVADVVIEAFACELPESYVRRMAVGCDSIATSFQSAEALHPTNARNRPPVWINLEYLTAESWIEDCHLGLSPHPRWPLTKVFFFPGFTARTGGLLRERDLERCVSPHRHPLSPEYRSEGSQTIDRWRVSERDELRVSLFCYDNTSLVPWLNALMVGKTPVRLLVTAGLATEQCGRWLDSDFSPGTCVVRGSLTLEALPMLSHVEFDQLLWSCDLNFVRGEDSFVRAQWAQRPFVWQIYPQTDDAHVVKLNAFLDRYLSGVTAEAARTTRCFWHAWNGIGAVDTSSAWYEFVPHIGTLTEHSSCWVRHLDHLGDLANNLADFVVEFAEKQRT